MLSRQILCVGVLLMHLVACNIVIAETPALLDPAVLTTTPETTASFSTIQAGVHYKRLAEKIRNNNLVQQLLTTNANKVQVFMFFNYGCTVCRGLNKPFDAWSHQQDSKKIVISKLPVSFNRGWATLAQAFYVVQVLHKEEKLDEAIFAAIHEQKQPLWVEEKLADFLANNGVERTLFNNAKQSFKVNTQVKWAQDLARAFELSSIPHIIISGPYGTYLTNLSMTKEHKFLFEVIDYLVKKELKKVD